MDAVEAAIRIQLEGLPNREGGARMRGFSMHESDMEAFAKQPWVATSTDAGISLPMARLDQRAVLRQLPAQDPSLCDRARRHLDRVGDPLVHVAAGTIMGLKDRGLVREGIAADLVIFDLETIRDKATFFEPHQYSEGVEYVFVNGVAVVDNAKLTWALPGKVITR